MPLSHLLKWIPSLPSRSRPSNRVPWSKPASEKLQAPPAAWDLQGCVHHPNLRLGRCLCPGRNRMIHHLLGKVPWGTSPPYLKVFKLIWTQTMTSPLHLPEQATVCWLCSRPGFSLCSCRIVCCNEICIFCWKTVPLTYIISQRYCGPLIKCATQELPFEVF